MTIEEFTKKLEAEFEDMPAGTLTPDTSYRNVSGWGSMHALIIIAFFDSEFDIALTGENFRTAQTVRDLYAIVSEKTK